MLDGEGWVGVLAGLVALYSLIHTHTHTGGWVTDGEGVRQPRRHYLLASYPYTFLLSRGR